VVSLRGIGGATHHLRRRMLCSMNRRAILILIVLATFLLLAIPVTADAASGGATVSPLPESAELQVSVEIQNECSTEGCSWFGQATAYSASVVCPSSADDSHSVWTGSIETSHSTRGTFAFSPYGLENEIVVCLYVVEGSQSYYVGQSHPFDRTTGREVLPQPPPRYPTTTTVKVTVRGCHFLPHVYVNGKTNIGGYIKQVWRRVWRGHRERSESEVTEAGGYRWGKKPAPPGNYSISARFLGDSNLLPSPKFGAAYFTISSRC